MATCQDTHRYNSLFSALPEDQSYPFRHKCAGCAYELGLVLHNQPIAKRVRCN